MSRPTWSGLVRPGPAWCRFRCLDAASASGLVSMVRRRAGQGDMIVVEPQRFAIVPEWVLDLEVSDAALRLYELLLRYGGSSGRACRRGGCWPSGCDGRSTRLPGPYATSRPPASSASSAGAAGGRTSPTATTCAPPTPRRSSGRLTLPSTHPRPSRGKASPRGVAADLRPNRKQETQNPPPPPLHPAGRGAHEERRRRSRRPIEATRCSPGAASPTSVRSPSAAKPRDGRSACPRPGGRRRVCWPRSSSRCCGVGRPSRSSPPCSRWLRTGDAVADAAGRAGPWWDQPPPPPAELDGVDLAALEAELDDIPEQRPALQAKARAELAHEHLPVTPATVTARAVHILHRSQKEVASQQPPPPS